MARLHFLLAAAAVTLPISAHAGVQVLGNSAARSCFEAAERDPAPRSQDFRSCNLALTEAATPANEIVASYVNRGILFLKTGQLDAALADFDRATALDPDQPEAYLNRGSALLKRKQVQRALTMFDEALRKKTARPELAYYARAVAHEELGNVREAFHDYQRASQLAPEWQVPQVELQRFRVVTQ